MRDAYSPPVAFNQRSLCGDLRSCFHVLGASTGGDSDALRTKFPRRLGDFALRDDRRGGAGSGEVRAGTGTGGEGGGTGTGGGMTAGIGVGETRRSG